MAPRRTVLHVDILDHVNVMLVLMATLGLDVSEPNALWTTIVPHGWLALAALAKTRVSERALKARSVRLSVTYQLVSAREAPRAILRLNVDKVSNFS